MIIENYCSMGFYGIIQILHCSTDDNDNDDNVSMWFEFFGGLF